jgi:hypothetical protein
MTAFGAKCPFGPTSTQLENHPAQAEQDVDLKPDAAAPVSSPVIVPDCSMFATLQQY